MDYQFDKALTEVVWNKSLLCTYIINKNFQSLLAMYYCVEFMMICLIINRKIKKIK